jgi:hypothetical protein
MEEPMTASEILEHAQRRDWTPGPIVFNTAYSATEGAWQAAVRRATPAVLSELKIQLVAADAEDAASLARRSSPERGIDPLSTPDPFADQMRSVIVEARERAEYDASVPGKLDRIANLLESAVDELRLGRRARA